MNKEIRRTAKAEQGYHHFWKKGMDTFPVDSIECFNILHSLSLNILAAVRKI